MKSTNKVFCAALLLASWTFGSHAVVINDGSGSNNLDLLMNQNGVEGAEMNLTPADLDGNLVLVSAQSSGGEQFFPVRTAWHPNFLSMTGGVYTVSALYKPAGSNGEERANQNGGVIGWLNLETQTGVALTVIPGDNFTDPAFHLTQVDFGANNGFDNESTFNLFDPDGSNASLSTSSAASDVGNYDPAQFAVFEISFTAPTAADLANVPGATARISARVTQGTDINGNPFRLGRDIELLTDLPLPAVENHKVGYFAYYGNIFAGGDREIGFHDDLTVEGDVGEINFPPSIEILSPLEEEELFTNAEKTISITATDPDGSVAEAVIFVNGNEIGRLAAPPFDFTWDESREGEFEITAEAIDDKGKSASAGPVTVTLVTPPNMPPVVVIVRPEPDSIFSDQATVVVEAEASDADGGVQEVQFFDTGVFVGSATEAPYEISLTGLFPGIHNLTATAVDSSGDSTTSEPVSFVVRQNAPPEIAITSPMDGQSFRQDRLDLTIQATATDADGNVASVEYFDGETSIGVSSQAPFSFVWVDVPEGEHTLTARARDDLGAVSTSEPVVFTFSEPPPPPTDAPVLAFRIADGMLEVSWPAEYLGSTLQTSGGVPGNWTDVPGSESVTAMTFELDSGATRFFRLEAEGGPIDPPPTGGPSLSITFENDSVVGDAVILSWEQEFAGWILQGSADPGGSQWEDISSEPDGTGFVDAADSPYRFYRLRRP